MHGLRPELRGEDAACRRAVFALGSVVYSAAARGVSQRAHLIGKASTCRSELMWQSIETTSECVALRFLLFRRPSPCEFTSCFASKPNTSYGMCMHFSVAVGVFVIVVVVVSK